MNAIVHARNVVHSTTLTNFPIPFRWRMSTDWCKTSQDYVGMLYITMPEAHDPSDGSSGELTFQRLVPSDILKNDQKLVRFVFQALVDACRHELAEQFTIDGLRPFDPHADGSDDPYTGYYPKEGI